jgi:hypothetical protein
MSKRFGRNQKRKLQEEVRRLAEGHKMAAGLQRHTTKELERARDALRVIYHEIGKNLNPYHPLLPAEVRKQLSVAATDLSFVQLPIDRAVCRTIEVLRRRFLTDEFRQMVAVRISHKGREIGYAIDTKALMVASFRQEYVKDLATDIAEVLTREIQKWEGR